MELVLHDGAAQAQPWLPAGVLGLDGFIPALVRLPLRDAVDRDEALVLVVGEDLAVEIVAPDFVTAVVTALDAFWYSALKFWVMTLNS
ncbi:MAG: hypothetical protein IPP07_28870 [Holophagales bacterium]|nr:hypothetical protein [Holophagales bacterium]